ncbi:MAG: hypothetical protein ACKVT0_11955 [Planctomycetaceae bacterium]
MGTSILGSLDVHSQSGNRAFSTADTYDSPELDDDFETTIDGNPVSSVDRLATSQSLQYATWHRFSQLVYARNAVRVPYSRRISVIPLDDAGQPTIDEAVLVQGRDLSALGLSFDHDRPLVLRDAWVAFVEESAQTRSIWKAELKWCRFTRQGKYVSGGRLLHAGRFDAKLLANWRNFPGG